MKHGVLQVVSSLILLLLAAPISAAPVLITDIQYWLAPDHIQTIISFDQAVEPSHHHRSNPARFVLEIPDCEFIYGNQTIPVNDITLQQIRVQHLNNGMTQIVFDLSEKVRTTVQMLPRVNGQPDRVIVNLFDESNQEQQQVERHQITTQLKQNRYHIVVLDPGHGGQDPGAIGPNGLQEKDIVLALARKMQQIIQKEAPYIKVYLTRDGDYFLSLRKRTEIAKDYNADLFVSLHVNANPNQKVNGFSIYTLSENATDEAARDLAEKENAADVLFGAIETPVPDDDSLLKFVLADLSMTSVLQHSLEFGRISVHKTVAELRKYQIHKEGLKRANFIVLRSADMPAVLIEACYVSNKREEKLLSQQEFRNTLAQSLAKSTIEYFDQMRNTMRPQVAQLREEPVSLPISPDLFQEPARHKVHVVKSGESLSLIAGKYNVKLLQLCQVNKLSSADLIYVGQRLWIP